MSNLHPLLQEHMQRAGVDGQMLNPAVTALLKQVSATYTRVERCLADEVGVASRLLPILRTDVAGTLIEWNAQIAELTGVPPSDVLGRSLMEHVEKAARPRVLRVLAKALQGQVVHCVQVPFLCPSGDVQMLSLGANAHYDVKGRLVGVLAVAQLLPQQHHASVPSSPATSEASAGGGTAAGPSPIDCMNVACVATDAHGKVVTWNQTMESLSGYSRAEVRSGRGSDTRRARRTLARARSLPRLSHPPLLPPQVRGRPLSQLAAFRTAGDGSMRGTTAAELVDRTLCGEASLAIDVPLHARGGKQLVLQVTGCHCHCHHRHLHLHSPPLPTAADARRADERERRRRLRRRRHLRAARARVVAPRRRPPPRLPRGQGPIPGFGGARAADAAVGRARLDRARNLAADGPRAQGAARDGVGVGEAPDGGA